MWRDSLYVSFSKEIPDQIRDNRNEKHVHSSFPTSHFPFQTHIKPQKTKAFFHSLNFIIIDALKRSFMKIIRTKNFKMPLYTYFTIGYPHFPQGYSHEKSEYFRILRFFFHDFIHILWKSPIHISKEALIKLLSDFVISKIMQKLSRISKQPSLFGAEQKTFLSSMRNTFSDFSCAAIYFAL